MELARAGYLSTKALGTWTWRYRNGSTASVLATGRRHAVHLDYHVKQQEKWQSVSQRIPIRWANCHNGDAAAIQLVEADDSGYQRQMLATLPAHA
jgi:hypothetical protein